MGKPAPRQARRTLGPRWPWTMVKRALEVVSKKAAAVAGTNSSRRDSKRRRDGGKLSTNVTSCCVGRSVWSLQFRTYFTQGKDAGLGGTRADEGRVFEVRSPGRAGTVLGDRLMRATGKKRSFSNRDKLSHCRWDRSIDVCSTGRY